jgi:hypothetical protein
MLGNAEAQGCADWAVGYDAGGGGLDAEFKRGLGAVVDALKKHYGANDEAEVRNPPGQWDA